MEGSVDPRTDFSRLALPVAKVDLSADFYGVVLGLREIDAGGSSPVRRFAWANGVVLELQPAETTIPSAQGIVLVLRVDDLEGVRSRLERAGSLAAADARRRRVVGKDPDGNRLVFFEGRGVAPGMSSHSRLAGTKFVLEEEVRVRGDPDTVWKAFMDQSVLSAWLCGGPAQVNPRPGGRLLLTFPHLERPHSTWNCVIREYIPPARFRFEEQEIGIQVTFDLAPDGDGAGTLVRLTQTPYDLSDQPDDPGRVAQEIALTWRRMLRRLALYLEDELEPEEGGG